MDNADRKKVCDKCRETNLGHYLYQLHLFYSITKK